MVAQTKYDVASAALVMVGAQPVTSFNEASSTESIACFHHYDKTVNNMLEMHNWRFATKVQQLSRLSTAPKTLWSAKYNVPADCHRVQNVRIDVYGQDIEYDRFEDEIHCDANVADTVYCIYVAKPPESEWPGYFTELVMLALAQKFAFTLAAKLDLAEALAREKDQQFRLSKSIDSKQQTTRRLKVAGRRSIIEMRRM